MNTNIYSFMPKVTVLIPFYNRAAYLRSAIDSVLAQTLADFELLAIDDGSTDDSATIVAGYRDPRIRLLRNPYNLGIPAIRNLGVEQARGAYLAFLDIDDYALPRRLARQVAFLDANPDYAAVGAWIEWIDDAGKRTGRIKRKPLSAEQIGAERLFRSGLENSTAMARTAILRQFDHHEDMTLGSDYDLWARIAVDHKLATLPEVLVYRREHHKRTSWGQVESAKAQRRFKIFAWQLDALGVAYSEADLKRHNLLRRMDKAACTPDAEFVAWAEHWLIGLQAANRTARLYPEPAFSNVLGEFWLKTCWRAQVGNGRRPWQRFWRSPLRSAACSGALQFVQRHVQTRLPRRATPVS